MNKHETIFVMEDGGSPDLVRQPTFPDVSIGTRCRILIGAAIFAVTATCTAAGETPSLRPFDSKDVLVQIGGGAAGLHVRPNAAGAVRARRDTEPDLMLGLMRTPVQLHPMIASAGPGIYGKYVGTSAFNSQLLAGPGIYGKMIDVAAGPGIYGRLDAAIAVNANSSLTKGAIAQALKTQLALN